MAVKELQALILVDFATANQANESINHKAAKKLEALSQVRIVQCQSAWSSNED